jgi:hypothetical protein
VNNELERMWEEAYVAYLELLSQHLLGDAEGSHENLINDRRCPGRYSRLAPAEWEVLPLEPTRSEGYSCTSPLRTVSDLIIFVNTCL